MKTALMTLILAALLAADSAAQWTVVGPGKACLDGTVPAMNLQGGHPTLGIQPGQVCQLSVVAPGAPEARLVVGVSFLGAPFKGGVLGPMPTVVVPISASAAVVLGFPWPMDMDPGASLYFQAVLRDGGSYCMTETWKGTSA
jgi:hypothetical protein